MNSFPISPRQPIRKKSSKSICVDVPFEDPNVVGDGTPPEAKALTEKAVLHEQRSAKNNRLPIDRAKPRKSPHRPLPGKFETFFSSGNKIDGIFLCKFT